jgi:hypothetical protein
VYAAQLIDSIDTHELQQSIVGGKVVIPGEPQAARGRQFAHIVDIAYPGTRVAFAQLSVEALVAG